MDAYHYHQKFEDNIDRVINQTHFINAFLDEQQAEIDRLKNNKTTKRITSKVISGINETIYNRMLGWYKAEYNPLLTAKASKWRQEFYNVVSGTRYAAVWCYTLALLHRDTGVKKV